MDKAEALKLALEALESYKGFIEDAHIIEGQWHWIDGASNAITTIKQAIAAPTVQEPVAWMFEDDQDNGHKTLRQTPPSPEVVAHLAKWNRPAWVPLYTAPPAAQPAPVQPVQEADVFDDDIEVTGPTTIRTRYRLEVGTKLYTTPPAAPVQEPVAWRKFNGFRFDYIEHQPALSGMVSKEWKPLYDTTPPAAQRQWVGLTDEEMYLNCPNWLSQEQCKVWVQQIEAKLKEKNAAAQQAVPDAIHHTDLSESLEYIQGWNECRQAMLEMMK